jgi:hypothetical protein
MKGAKKDFLDRGRANDQGSGQGWMATSKCSSSVHELTHNVRPVRGPDTTAGREHGCSAACAGVAACALSELICPKPVLITFHSYRRIQGAILTHEGEMLNQGRQIMTARGTVSVPHS